MDWLELLGSIIQLVCNPSDKVGDFMKDFLTWVHSEVSQARGVEDELDSLRATKERIRALLHDVEVWRSVTEERVLRWLGDLNDVALDAEDLLDEFETRLALLELPATGRGRKRKRAGAPKSVFLFRRRVAKEIVEIRNRYEETCREHRRLQLQPDEAPPRRSLAARDQAPPTAAMIRPDVFRILGRDRDRENIVDLLLRQLGAGPAQMQVVPIYGMPGLGKTALAKYVYHDIRVAQRFQSRIWISTARGFDVVRITREILESLTGNACHLSNFTTLQRCAKELLAAREPFLLVLDDVKDDDGGGGGLHQHWEALQDSLPAVDGGSRVLITTRSERVAQEMGTLRQPGRLNGLSEQDCFALFQQRACADQEGFQLDQSQEYLREIGMAIARKCQGSPLAAISLGGALSRAGADEAEWRSMLEETAAFSHDGDQLDVLRVLRHSYELLPPRLKKCFAFCALFPPGHLFDRDELVKLWIAQGYVARMGSRRPEAIGNRYFDELLWMSFFQLASDRSGQNPDLCPRYEMPDLLHEVAQAVSKHVCVRSVLNQGDANPMHRARHLALCYRQEPTTVLFTGFPEHKRLRTLALQGEPRTTTATVQLQLSDLIFPKLTHLRVLDLGNTGIRVLPDSIGELVLLRYLSLYNSPIETLPESVADLRNLQTLELGECYDLVKLPDGTGDLTNLRHLGLRLDRRQGGRSSQLASMPPEMGKLTSLETLSRFAVGTRDGCGVSELKSLANLRGELWISKLENVAGGANEAGEANLKDKRHVKSLTLQWSSTTGSSAGPSTQQQQEEGGVQNVIDGLQPPAGIQHLSIDGYGGATPPSWMVGGTFSELVSMRISNCAGWESLPPLGRLPVLRELCIEGMRNITSMDPMFPAGGGEEERFPRLETIRLWDLPWLKRWTLVGEDMPRLRKLQIGRCPMLAYLPVAPQPGVQVILEDCALLQNHQPMLDNM